MKKITGNIIVLIFVAISAFMLGSPDACAETKRDVTDPVLSEIIQNFGLRMPRFIDKYGKDVFVADEPVTRANLMLAIYEYDKSMKTPKKDYVSKQEFEELSLKLKAMQALSSNPKKRNGGEESANIPPDISQFINELIPNMPVILDSSLDNSKVFLTLKEGIENLRAQDLVSSESQLRINMEQVREEIRQLSLKVDSIDRANAQEAKDEPGDLKKKLSLTRKQLAKLEKRVDTLENSKESGETVKNASAGQESKANTSVIAKLSMGLSMVAALFIAR